jgi:hypothetical protein
MEGRRQQPMMRIVLAPRENVNRTRTDRTKSGACRAAYQISSHRERVCGASSRPSALVITAHVDFNAPPNRRATPIDRQSRTLPVNMYFC